MISFIKTLRYDPIVNDAHNKYEGYRLSASGLSDPGIVCGAISIYKPNSAYECVFSSPTRRTQETASLLHEGQVQTLSVLSEIKFDITKLVTHSEYTEYGSALVRKRFVEAFVEDKLEESIDSIGRRVEHVIRRLQVESKIYGDILCVSHSFFMKVLEAYLDHDDLFLNRQILRNYIKPDEKTYQYGKGFEKERV